MGKEVIMKPVVRFILVLLATVMIALSAGRSSSLANTTASGSGGEDRPTENISL